MVRNDDILVVKGSHFAIKFAERDSGKNLAKEFWEQLDGQTQRRFLVLFQRFCDTGRLSSPDQWRKVGDGVREFKRSGYRIFSFRDGNAWYLTSGFKKSTKKRQNEAIKQAMRIRDEHMAR